MHGRYCFSRVGMSEIYLLAYSSLSSCTRKGTVLVKVPLPRTVHVLVLKVYIWLDKRMAPSRHVFTKYISSSLCSSAILLVSHVLIGKLLCVHRLENQELSKKNEHRKSGAVNVRSSLTLTSKPQVGSDDDI
jgi:hypothetical protein